MGACTSAIYTYLLGDCDVSDEDAVEGLAEDADEVTLSKKKREFVGQGN